MKYILSLAFLLLSLNLYAQLSADKCETIYKTAETLFLKGDYSLAIKKISAYKICADSIQSKKGDELLLKIYQTVNFQKVKAENQTRIAEAATERERQERIKAVNAEENAKAQEQIAKQEALTAKIEQKTSASIFYGSKDATLGYTYALQAYQLDPTIKNISGYSALLRSFYSKASYYKIFTGHKGHINAIAFSPTKDTIVSSATDSTTIFWNLRGEILKKIKTDAKVDFIDFSDDGNSLILSCTNGNVLIYDSAFSLKTTLFNDSYVKFASFVENETAVITTSKDSIIQWSLVIPNKKIKTYQYPKSYILKAAIANDRKSFATVSRLDNDGTVFMYYNKGESEIRIYNLSDSMPVKKRAASGIAFSIAFTYDNNLLISTWAGDIWLWYLQKDSIVRIVNSQYAISAIATTKNSSLAAAALGDQTVRIFNLPGKFTDDIYNGIESGCDQISFSKNSSLMAIEDADKLKLYKTNNQRIVNSIFFSSKYRIGYFRISADMKYAIIKKVNNEVVLIDLIHKRDTVLQKGENNGYTNLIASFSHDGERLILLKTGPLDFFSPVEVWNTNSFSRVYDIPSNITASIDFVSYTPNNRLITYSNSTKKLIWWYEVYNKDWEIALDINGAIKKIVFDSIGRHFIIMYTNNQSSETSIIKCQYKIDDYKLISKKRNIQDVDIFGNGTTVIISVGSEGAFLQNVDSTTEHTISNS